MVARQSRDPGAFGEERLAESTKRLVIPAYNLGDDDIYLFKTPHHERLKRDWKTPAWRVALATSAAPTYLPACRCVDRIRLIDGGVWANNPTMVGIVEAVSMLKVPLDSISVLSLGTSDPVADRPKRLDAGGRLQRTIQLLKRHRDLHFGDNKGDKPASIIITTLAAWAYSNEFDVFQALVNIVEGMQRHPVRTSGTFLIPNPANPSLAEAVAGGVDSATGRQARAFRDWP